MSPQQRVVVGVTGRGENTDALRYAAEVAAATGASLTLAHAAPPVLPLVPHGLTPSEDALLASADEVVAGVRDELVGLVDPAVPIETVVSPGDPGTALAELTERASLLVLQHRSLSAPRRIFTGSTVSGAVARAHCPVVSVPAGQHRAAQGLVVAAVLEDGGPREVTEAAFREADRRRCALVLLHAWRMSPQYDDLLGNDTSWRDELATALRAVADELGEKYPGVAVEVDVEHRWPAEAVVAASEHADLVVLGRHAAPDHLGHLAHPRLGTLGRAVVAHAHCPVMVVPV